MTAALERAKAEIMGPILNRTNLFNTELRVSTTFPSFMSSNSPPGVDLGRGPAVDTNNVNFDYDNLGNDFFAYTTPQWRDLYERLGKICFLTRALPSSSIPTVAEKLARWIIAFIWT